VSSPTRLARTLQNWFDQIVSWHEAKVSNGPTEGMNNLLKEQMPPVMAVKSAEGSALLGAWVAWVKRSRLPEFKWWPNDRAVTALHLEHDGAGAVEREVGGEQHASEGPYSSAFTHLQRSSPWQCSRVEDRVPNCRAGRELIHGTGSRSETPLRLLNQQIKSGSQISNCKSTYQQVELEHVGQSREKCQMCCDSADSRFQ
jgi:hypothetical protein